MNQQAQFDAQAAEHSQIDLILDKGVFFTVPKKSLLRLVGNADRRFTIKQAYAGTLVYLCREMLKLSYDEKELSANFFEEAKRTLAENSALMGRIVAIMVLRDRWKIQLFLPFLASYFNWRITPQKLRQLTDIILTIANIPDFIISTRSLSLKRRVTAPALVETPEIGQPDSTASSATGAPFVPISPGS